MSDELKKRLPQGVAIIFFENVGWLNANGSFTSRSFSGYFAIGYSCNKELNRPSAKAKAAQLQKAKGLAALTIQLVLLNKEKKRFILFGEPDELVSIQEGLKDSFASGNPLVINTDAEEGDNLPLWWSER